MVRVRVRAWGMDYFYRSPHKDSSTIVFVCQW